MAALVKGPTAVALSQSILIADLGAAEMWKGPDFGTRSYSTRIQGSKI